MLVVFLVILAFTTVLMPSVMTQSEGVRSDVPLCVQGENTVVRGEDVVCVPKGPTSECPNGTHVGRDDDGNDACRAQGKGTICVDQNGVDDYGDKKNCRPYAENEIVLDGKQLDVRRSLLGLVPDPVEDALNNEPLGTESPDNEPLENEPLENEPLVTESVAKPISDPESKVKTDGENRLYLWLEDTAAIFDIPPSMVVPAYTILIFMFITSVVIVGLRRRTGKREGMRIVGSQRGRSEPIQQRNMHLDQSHPSLSKSELRGAPVIDNAYRDHYRVSKQAVESHTVQNQDIVPEPTLKIHYVKNQDDVPKRTTEISSTKTQDIVPELEKPNKDPRYVLLVDTNVCLGYYNKEEKYNDEINQFFKDDKRFFIPDLVKSEIMVNLKDGKIFTLSNKHKNPTDSVKTIEEIHKEISINTDMTWLENVKKMYSDINKDDDMMEQRRHWIMRKAVKKMRKNIKKDAKLEEQRIRKIVQKTEGELGEALVDPEYSKDINILSKAAYLSNATKGITVIIFTFDYDFMTFSNKIRKNFGVHVLNAKWYFDNLGRMENPIDEIINKPEMDLLLEYTIVDESYKASVPYHYQLVLDDLH